MNRWIFTILFAVLVLSLSIPALAAEGEDMADPTQEPVTVETEADDKSIVVNVTLPAVPAPTPTPDVGETDIDAIVEPAYTPYSVSALDDAPPSGATLTDTVTTLFGSYVPRTQTITDYLTDGTTVTYQQIIPGLAGLDWPWLASVGLFSLFLYGLLRLVGGLLKL